MSLTPRPYHARSGHSCGSPWRKTHSLTPPAALHLRLSHRASSLKMSCGVGCICAPHFPCLSFQPHQKIIFSLLLTSFTISRNYGVTKRESGLPGGHGPTLYRFSLLDLGASYVLKKGPGKSLPSPFPQVQAHFESFRLYWSQ